MCGCVGWTLLHEAVHPLGEATVKLLVQHGALLSVDTRGQSPIHLLLNPREVPDSVQSDKNLCAVLSALLAAPNSAKFIDTLTKRAHGRPGLQRWSALAAAAHYGWPRCMSLLLKHNADVNLCTHGGTTGMGALHAALAGGQLAIAKQLVAAGACVHPVLTTFEPTPTTFLFRFVSLSQFVILNRPDNPDLLKWCRSMETKTELRHCEKCSLDGSEKSFSRLRSLLERTNVLPRCANPLCPLPREPKQPVVGPDGFTISQAVPIRLKKCSRCLQAAYCGPVCQRQHWKKGHKADCKPPAAAEHDHANTTV